VVSSRTTTSTSPAGRGDRPRIDDIGLASPASGEFTDPGGRGGRNVHDSPLRASNHWARYLPRPRTFSTARGLSGHRRSHDRSRRCSLMLALICTVSNCCGLVRSTAAAVCVLLYAPIPMITMVGVPFRHRSRVRCGGVPLVGRARDVEFARGEVAERSGARRFRARAGEIGLVVGPSALNAAQASRSLRPAGR
jgi:hypothetical protein